MSDNGIVYNIKKGKVVKPWIQSKGYMQVEIEGKKKLVHRLVYEAFHGNIPQGFDVHHINHVKTDNRMINLDIIKRELHGFLHAKIQRNNTHKGEKPILQKACGRNVILDHVLIDRRMTLDCVLIDQSVGCVGIE